MGGESHLSMLFSAAMIASVGWIVGRPPSNPAVGAHVALLQRAMATIPDPALRIRLNVAHGVPHLSIVWEEFASDLRFNLNATVLLDAVSGRSAEPNENQPALKDDISLYIQCLLGSDAEGKAGVVFGPLQEVRVRIACAGGVDELKSQLSTVAGYFVSVLRPENTCNDSQFCIDWHTLDVHFEFAVESTRLFSGFAAFLKRVKVFDSSLHDHLVARVTSRITPIAELTSVEIGERRIVSVAALASALNHGTILICSLRVPFL
jgi:hypothetical protein